MSEALPATERDDPATADLDRLDDVALAHTLVIAHERAIVAARDAAPSLAAAIEAIAQRLHDGGTWHTAGAGTSGRLGALDAAEMPPTFGTDPALVRAHLAGGADAFANAIEGAEDDADAGTALAQMLAPRDVLVALSASGGAPYVVAAVRAARERGVLTIGIACVAPSPLLDAAALPIALLTGPEPLAGSTRLVAGTAQKIALNTLSTGVMVRLGKTYGNLMVDVRATNVKLRARARRLVVRLAAVDDATAQRLLAAADGRVKTAVVMGRLQVNAADANARLEAAGGRLREALGE